MESSSVQHLTSVHSILRARTAPAHAEVDAAFSRFDLSDRASYINLLLAHARVLSAIEPELSNESRLPPWRPRLALLAFDLNVFGVHLPMPMAVVGGSSLAEHLGMLYVIEGSRLGNRVLADRLPRDFPASYLSTGHEKGEWRSFTLKLDTYGSAQDELWLQSVVVGARRGFRLYATSAAQGFALSPHGS